MRGLEYDRSRERLFFTTTLQRAVQCFSIRDGKLLDAATQHPRSPTVFAVCPSFAADTHSIQAAAAAATDLASDTVLLSASPEPPVIHLTNVLPGGVPFLLQPACSTAAVVAATFHPRDTAPILALAFADGSLAVYDVARLHRSLGNGAASLDSGEVGHVKNLHISITAIAFLHRGRTIVSVGLDGKCNVTKFIDQGQHSSGTFVYGWHVSKPATSLAIAPGDTPTNLANAQRDQDKAKICQDSGSTCLDDVATGQAIVAIGLDNGDVRLYSLPGVLISKHSFGSLHVLGLEWLDRAAPGTDSGSSSSFHQPSPSISQISIPKIRKPSSNSRRVASTRRTRARPPSIPPRPIPKEGGKLAQRQAERASQDSEDTKAPSSAVTREPKPATKGRKLVIQAHSRGSMRDSSKSPSQPSSQSQNTAFDWTAVEDQSSKIAPSTTASLLVQESASTTPSLPQSPSQSQQNLQPQRPLQKPPPPQHSFASLDAATSEDLRSFLTGSTNSTGTVVDWAPHALQQQQQQQQRQPTLGARMLFNHAGDMTPSAQDSTGTSVFHGLDSSRPNISAAATANVRRGSASMWSSMPVDSAVTPMLLKAVFEDEFALFQARVMLELREHREWMEKTLQEQNAAILRLCEENKTLRGEMSRKAHEKGH